MIRTPKISCYLTLILWLLFCNIALIFGNKEAKFTDVQNLKKVAKNNYVNLKGLSEVQCVGHCTLTDDCHSVNYHGDDQICLVIDEIFEGDGDSHLIDAHGWKFFKKTRMVLKLQIYLISIL